MCIGSTLNFIMDDTEDVKNRINKVTKSMGAFNVIWEAREIPLKSKIKLHEAMLMDLLLWESDDWSVNKGNVNMCVQNK